MSKGTTYVGIDDGKRKLVVGILRPGEQDAETARHRERAQVGPAAGRSTPPIGAYGSAPDGGAGTTGRRGRVAMIHTSASSPSP